MDRIGMMVGWRSTIRTSPVLQSLFPDSGLRRDVVNFQASRCEKLAKEKQLEVTRTRTSVTMVMAKRWGRGCEGVRRARTLEILHLGYNCTIGTGSD